MWEHLVCATWACKPVPPGGMSALARHARALWQGAQQEVHQGELLTPGLAPGYVLVQAVGACCDEC